LRGLRRRHHLIIVLRMGAGRAADGSSAAPPSGAPDSCAVGFAGTLRSFVEVVTCVATVGAVIIPVTVAAGPATPLPEAPAR
jgi:hypothetical protein